MLGPPRGLIAPPVERAVMQSAERHGEFVAHPAAECGALGKSEMMRVRRSPTAEEARLQGHEFEVIAVAVAPRLAQGQIGLVDLWSTRVLRNGFLTILYGEWKGSTERQFAAIRFFRSAMLA